MTGSTTAYTYAINYYTDGTAKYSSILLTKVGVTDTYTVTFDTDGGSAIEAQTVASGAVVTPPTVPTKEGYTFAGWYLEDAPYNFETPVTADITLVAKWEAAA